MQNLESTQFLCPFCNKKESNKNVKFPSWRSVAMHSKYCKSNPDQTMSPYVFDDIGGPIHVSYFQHSYSSNYIRYLLPNVKKTLSSIRDQFTKRNFEIDTENSQTWKSEELLQLLKDFYEEHKEIPQIKDFRFNAKYPSDDIYRKNFNSWENALMLAGLTYTSNFYWSTTEIINSIKIFYKEHNRIPQSKEFANNSKYPSYTTVISRFKYWNTAISKAGFTPNYESQFGIRTLGLDGIWYMSRMEAYFADNYLYNKLIYEYEKPYGNGWWYDFYLPEKDLYVELDGFLRPERMKEKIKFNELNNRKLLVLTKTQVYKKDFEL